MAHKNLFLLCVLAVWAVACTPRENTVSLAAQQRWEALISGTLEQAYQFYTKAFQQATPLTRFRQQIHGTGLWNKAKVENVNCVADTERCTVDVKISVSLRMAGLSEPVETSDVVQETWIRDGWFSDWRYIK